YARLLRASPFVPRNLQLFPGALRLPPRIRDDRDAGLEIDFEAEHRDVFHLSVHEEGVLHTGQLLDLVEVGVRGLATEHGTFLVHGEEHVRDGEVDRIAGLARHDVLHVVAALAVADDREVLRILQLHGLQVRHRYGCGPRGELAVAGRSIRRPVRATTRLRGELGRRDA